MCESAAILSSTAHTMYKARDGIGKDTIRPGGGCIHFTHGRNTAASKPSVPGPSLDMPHFAARSLARQGRGVQVAVQGGRGGGPSRGRGVGKGNPLSSCRHNGEHIEYNARLPNKLSCCRTGTPYVCMWRMPLCRIKCTRAAIYVRIHVYAHECASACKVWIDGLTDVDSSC